MPLFKKNWDTPPDITARLNIYHVLISVSGTTSILFPLLVPLLLRLQTKKFNAMKKIIGLLSLVSLSLISCENDDAYFGSGRAVTETRFVESFTKVKSEGVFDVTITQGLEQSLEITADDNIIGHVKTTVANNELRLSLKNDGYHDITLKARITIPQLNSLVNSGTGNMEISGFTENGLFKISNSGTGHIKIAGKAQSLSVFNEGTGKIQGFQFDVNEAEVKNLGSGQIEVHCSEHLKVNIQGNGNVLYKGNPTLQVNIKGSGSVLNSN